MGIWRWITETAATWTPVGIWIRLAFAMAVGMFIGIDRGMKRRGAGIKTHVLVALGSALVMLTSEYMLRAFPDAKADMARMGAQVISGIGFLGVGSLTLISSGILPWYSVLLRRIARRFRLSMSAALQMGFPSFRSSQGMK